MDCLIFVSVKILNKRVLKKKKLNDGTGGIQY